MAILFNNLQLCKEQAGEYILYSCTKLCVTTVEIGQIAHTFLFIQTSRKCKQSLLNWSQSQICVEVLSGCYEDEYFFPFYLTNNFIFSLDLLQSYLTFYKIFACPFCTCVNITYFPSFFHCHWKCWNTSDSSFVKCLQDYTAPIEKVPRRQEKRLLSWTFQRL